MVLGMQSTGVAAAGVNTVAFMAGRLLFSWFFLKSAYAHLSNVSGLAQYAAMHKVPAPKVAVAGTGLLLLGGGLSTLLGLYVPVGMLLLVIFLIPTAFMMHKFWGLSDPMAAAGQAAQFWKNMTLAGAALMLFYFSSLYPEAWVYSLGR
jgi:putative oxidoreductase